MGRALLATAFNFRTRLSAEDAFANLRAAADPTDPRREFNGEVTPDGFTLSRIAHNHPYGAAWARMRGRIAGDGDGARVSGEHAPTAFVVWASALVLAGLMALTVRIVVTNLVPAAPLKNLIIPVVILAAASAVCILSLWIGVRSDLAVLARTVGAVNSAAEPGRPEA